MIIKGIFAQYYSVFCVNLMTLLYGISIGWASSSLLLLQSKETPLNSGPLSLFEVSWIGSILCIGGALGQLLFGWLADKYGRKPGFMIAFVPAVISWLLIEFGQEFYSLFISRFLSGLVGGAVYQIVPLFVSEMADVEIRGLLGSFLMLFTNLGTLCGYILCSFVSFRVVPWIAILIGVIFMLGFSLVPETPKYLMMIGDETRMKKSLNFYKGGSHSSTTDKNDEIDMKQEPTSIKLKIFCEKSTKNAFKLGLTCMSVTCFTGVFTILNYTDTIFAEAGSNLSPAVSSIILASIQLAGSYVATIVVERAGRKILIISSSYGAAICVTVMGLHALLRDLGVDVSQFSYLPLVSLSLLVFIAANGATTVSFIVIGEIFEQKIRGLAISLNLLYQWLLAFILVLIFPYLKIWLGMAGALWMFAIVEICLATTLVFIMPETKGKSIDDIVKILGESRIKNDKI